MIDYASAQFAVAVPTQSYATEQYKRLSKPYE